MPDFLSAVDTSPLLFLAAAIALNAVPGLITAAVQIAALILDVRAMDEDNTVDSDEVEALVAGLKTLKNGDQS